MEKSFQALVISMWIHMQKPMLHMFHLYFSYEYNVLFMFHVSDMSMHVPCKPMHVHYVASYMYQGMSMVKILTHSQRRGAYLSFCSWLSSMHFSWQWSQIGTSVANPHSQPPNEPAKPRVSLPPTLETVHSTLDKNSCDDFTLHAKDLCYHPLK